MVIPSSSPTSMAKAIEATAGARNVVVFSGAGMSADSGIGTFRGQKGGYWSGLFGTLSLVWGGTPIGWKVTPGLVWNRFVNDFYTPIIEANPHAGHVALQELNERGNYDTFSYITMNVDGLHQTSGATNDQVSEVHGSVLKYRCMSCDEKITNIFPQQEEQQQQSALAESNKDDDNVSLRRLDPNRQPRCEGCGGRARPDVTLFTESLPEEEWTKAISFVRKLKRGDVMLVVGTSSVVYPAASIPERVASAPGVTVIEFNKDFPTPLSSIAKITIQGCAAETFPEFVKGVLEKRSI